MILSSQDKKYLKSIGYPESDFDQIEVASTLTRYRYKGKLICAERAEALIGREKFLSRLGRSAFHWSSSAETQDGEFIFFDSSPMFK